MSTFRIGRSTLFDPLPYQFRVLLMGFALTLLPIPVSLILSHGEPSILTTTLSSIGTSVLAAALVFKLGSRPDESAERARRHGILFLGDRKDFDSEFDGKGNKSAWDSWIQATPYDGELLVCGKKNFEWIRQSSDALLHAVERKRIRVRFFFMGTEEDYRRNIETFAGVLEEHLASRTGHQRILLEERLECHGYAANPGEESTGFYFNGRQMVSKVYLPRLREIDCPLLVFRLPDTYTRFDVGRLMSDLHNEAPKKSSLIACVESLSTIIAGSKKVSALPVGPPLLFRTLIEN